MKKRLFIVANRLPVHIEKKESAYRVRSASGGLISAVGSYVNQTESEQFSEKIWAGVPDITEQEWNHVPDKLVKDFTCLPVFVGKRLYDHYYSGFSNSLIWPLFHYFPSFADYNAANYDAYIKVNKLFAETLAQQLRSDDIVWIHDYHLLPLAAMLRKKFPALTIGFFLHIPFPSYELFRSVPKQWRRQLLSGMLGADLLGFHTDDYVAHFASSVKEILNADCENGLIEWQGRQVKIKAFPISIDFGLYNSAYDQEGVVKKRTKYLELKKGKKLIFSVDRLDYTKGIFNRLKGYKEFLKLNPSFKGKVFFALVLVPSRDTIGKYAERKKMIDEFIGNLNSTYGSIEWQPVIYQYGHLSFDDLLGLYTSCDLALITPLRDGMNLVSKEFVASRRDKRGVLVLSEMAGAANELKSALLINPNDSHDIAEKIKTGLEMGDEEQEARLTGMQQIIKDYDVNHWAADFFKHLKTVTGAQLKFGVKFLDDFSRVHLLNDYQKAAKRLLLLDYDGTLVVFKEDPSVANPEKALLSLLESLSKPIDNQVYIISGRDSQTLDNWLGHLNINLVAEHGGKIRYAGGDWSVIPEAGGITASSGVESVMENFTHACPGSFIEKKEFSIAWHYRKSEKFLAAIKAKELYSELVEMSYTFPLNVLYGNKVIEVKSKLINKGIAVEKIVRNGQYDFICCIGDDATDEDMFKKLAGIPHAVCIKVGDGPSFANYNLLTPYQVCSLLQHIAAYPEKLSPEKHLIIQKIKWQAL